MSNEIVTNTRKIYLTLLLSVFSKTLLNVEEILLSKNAIASVLSRNTKPKTNL